MRLPLLLCLPMLSFASAPWAGCPAVPGQAVRLIVESCRFHAAADDAEFVARVIVHFGEDPHRSGAELARLRDAVLQQNTGLLITGSRAQDGPAETFFLRTQDTAACGRFESGSAHVFQMHTTCPMVPFEAPTRQVLRE